jgi:hypothetical protein
VSADRGSLSPRQGRVSSSGNLAILAAIRCAFIAQSGQPLARTSITRKPPNCREGVHGHLFIICASQFRPDCKFGLWPWGMRMGGNRTLFSKSMTDLERVSDYVGVKPPRRTNDLLVLNNDDVLDLLRAAVKSEGSQTAFAKHHGLNRSHLNMVLHGKRPMGHAVADALGLRIVYMAK